MSFLGACSMSPSKIPYDQTFHQLCCEEAARRAFPLSGEYSVGPFIPGGVTMATTAYGHLGDQDTRIYLALHLAAIFYVDDMLHRDRGPIYDFQDRFVRRIPQAVPTLEAYDVCSGKQRFGSLALQPILL